MKDSVNQTSASGVCTVPTPLPWFVGARESTAITTGSPEGLVLYRGLSQANAALIVRAVNSRAELTNVLRLSATAFDSIANGIPNHEIYAAKCAETVREVLARLAEATK